MDGLAQRRDGFRRAAAFEQVRRSRATAVVVLKPGFGVGQENMFWGTPPGIALGVDPARRAEAGMLQGILIKYAVEGMQDGFARPDKMRASVARAASTGVMPSARYLAVSMATVSVSVSDSGVRPAASNSSRSSRKL